jgi:hypothetical protein
VGLRKPRTIITGIIITGTMVDTPSRATGTIIALVGRGEVPTWSQLVKQLGSVLLLSLTLDRRRFRILISQCDCAASREKEAVARRIRLSVSALWNGPQLER